MAVVARIYVTPRADVLDPQGKAVGNALRALGFDEVGEVRVGRYLEVELPAGGTDAIGDRLHAMCDKLLANPVVEDFRYEIEDSAGGDP